MLDKRGGGEGEGAEEGEREGERERERERERDVSAIVRGVNVRELTRSLITHEPGAYSHSRIKLSRRAANDHSNFNLTILFVNAKLVNKNETKKKSM